MKKIFFILCLFSLVSTISCFDLETNKELVNNKTNEIERSQVGTVADEVVHKTKNVVAYSIVKMVALLKILKNYISKSVGIIGDTSGELYEWAYKRTLRENTVASDNTKTDD